MQRKRRRHRIGSMKLFFVVSLFFVVLGIIFHLNGISDEQELNPAYSTKQNEDRIHYILENSEKYPKELLELLESNPETADFVAAYPSVNRNKIKTVSREEREEEHPLLMQWDKRWGYARYGGSMIAISGCGPTCLSMAIVGLTHESVSPYDVAKFSEENGYYVKGTGTAWALISEGASYYGVSSEEISLSESVMRSVLDSSGMIICAMGPGDFTTEGHYILIYGYENGEFLVNDPNSRERSRKKWSYSKLSCQIRNLWALYKA